MTRLRSVRCFKVKGCSSGSVAIGSPGLVAFLPSSSGTSETVSAIFFVASMLTVLVLGGVVTARQPENPIGRLLQLVAVGAIATLWGASVLARTDPAAPGGLDAIGLLTMGAGSTVLLAAIFLMLYLFPTGRFLSRRWRNAATTFLVGFGTVLGDGARGHGWESSRVRFGFVDQWYPCSSLHPRHPLKWR